MVIQHRVEAGRKGAASAWRNRRAKEAAIAAKLALWPDLTEAVKLLAHPKFITDDQGHIRYYVTQSDIEFARALLTRITELEKQ